MEETFLREEETKVERDCPHKKMRDKCVLRRQKDFDRVYRKGKSVGSRYVVVFTLKNHLPYPRIAFLASKKVGNSVQRNRARRLMKESMRLTEIQLPEGYDYIFIARNTINDAKCPQVRRSLEDALKRTGVITVK
jgi:ribonuclease P protein component